MSDNSNFYVDTAGIARFEPFMRELGAQLRAVGEALQASLDDLGSCWGDDQTGQEFLAQYHPGAESIKEAVAGTSALFDSTSDGIATMAKQLDNLESDNTDAVNNSLRKPSGSASDVGSGSGRGVSA